MAYTAFERYVSAFQWDRTSSSEMGVVLLVFRAQGAQSLLYELRIVSTILIVFAPVIFELIKAPNMISNQPCPWRPLVLSVEWYGERLTSQRNLACLKDRYAPVESRGPLQFTQDPFTAAQVCLFLLKLSYFDLDPVESVVEATCTLQRPIFAFIIAVSHALCLSADLPICKSQ